MSSWSCVVCTFDNRNMLAPVCEMCGSERERVASGSGEASAVPSGWSCGRCTAINADMSAVDCEVCGSRCPAQMEARRREEEQRAREAEEEKRRAAELAKRTEAQQLSDMIDYYSQVYAAQQALGVRKGTGLALRHGMVGTPAELEGALRARAGSILLGLYIAYGVKPAPLSSSSSSSSLSSPHCLVCYSDFDEKDTVAMKVMSCGHRNICKACFLQNLKVKISSKDVVPWVVCPAENCKASLHAKEIAACGLTVVELYSLLQVFISKMLARADTWVECRDRTCQFGWHVPKEAKKETKACPACSTVQTVEPRKEEMDEEFKKMIADGTLRPCPKCQHLTMKEKGICNVIQCVKCAIWWNWRSRETGNSSTELKDRARARGTLWEPGELHYQMRLERDDPAAFKALLERNGMKYDPNYVRGRG